ncbi:MAG: Hpt domain-containing protein, partial [Deltaproteobacteria bacterium]|nr:Hpt domain-containing protein [Deltaproteobacteria bacterium]
MPENEMDEIINDFVTESMESLDSLDQKFVELEKNPGDTVLLNDIFRSVHTIKGASGFLGFQQIVDITHVTEDVLNKLRKGEMFVNPRVMDAILQSIDIIKVMIKKVKDRDITPVEIQPAIALLNGILTSMSAPAGTAPEAPAPSRLPTASPASVQAGAPPVSVEAGIVKPLAVKEADAPAPRQTEAPKQAAKSDDAGHQKEQSIRVDIDRLDSVMNLIGELVLSRNRLLMLGGKLSESKAGDELTSSFNEAIAQLNLNTTDIQLAVMKMRMQPIAKVFNKFPRMVRDLARQNEKEIELVIHGEETELDKTVIEEIGDPLVHLIRNSADHGIETPDERAAKGKPR